MIQQILPATPLPLLTTAHDATQRSWLEQLPPARRGVIANWSHDAVREGCGTPGAVVHQVTHLVQQRLQWVSDPTQEAHLQAVLAALQVDRQGALTHATSIIAYECLPYAERQQQKQARSAPYRQAYMAAQPVTDRQFAFLHHLGHVGPAPANRLEASIAP